MNLKTPTRLIPTLLALSMASAAHAVVETNGDFGKLSLGGTDPAAPANVSTTDVRFDAAPQVFGRSELRSFR